VRLYGYIPNFAFLAHLTPEARAELERKGVTLGLFHPAYKISSTCFMEIDQRDEKTGGTKESSNIYNVLIFAGEDVQTFKSKIKQRFGAEILSEAPMKNSYILRIKLRPIYVTEIAKMVEVMWIEKYVPPKIEKEPDIENYWATLLVQSGTYATPIYDQGISGANQVVCVADTGLDYDHSMFYDYTNGPPPYTVVTDKTNPPINTDPALRKVIAYYDWAGTGDYDGYGHGTHVCGSVAGDYDNIAGFYEDFFGNGQFWGTYNSWDPFEGVAYNAKLIMQDIGDGGSLVGLPTNLYYLFQQAQQSGAHIHSNSWGASAQSLYLTESAQIDQYTWDNKDFLILFAAGNDGPGLCTMDTQAVAKNCIGVGATQLLYQDPNSMASFSSHGPATVTDGTYVYYTDRIKPDIAAPGNHYVVSAESDFDVTTFNNDSTGMGGTSMSTPIMAGAAALVREYFTGGYYPGGVIANPSSALLKATLINSAVNMTGDYVGNDLSWIYSIYGDPRYRKLDIQIPGTGQGWGLVFFLIIRCISLEKAKEQM